MPQQYLPDGLTDKHYYQPTRHGAEAEVAERMEERLEHPPVTQLEQRAR